MTRRRHQGGARRPRPTKPRKANPADIERLYVVDGLPGSAVAKRLGVSKAVVYRTLAARGVPCRNATKPRRAMPRLRPVPGHPGLLAVPLAGGHHAIIDETDADRVKGLLWYRMKGGVEGGRPVYYAANKSGATCTLMHRHLFGLGADDSVVVDHRNHDGLDNRRRNLRLATQGQNCANSRKRIDGSGSRFKGVARRKGRSAWMAQIGFEKRHISLGQFAAEAEAAYAYRAAAEFLHSPEFAFTTEIPPDELPPPGRLAEIRREAIKRVKRRLESDPRQGMGRAIACKQGSASEHLGVRWYAANQKWIATVYHEKKMRSLGFYDAESEAAQAFNVAADFLGLDAAFRNKVGPASETVGAVAAAKIRAAIEGRKGRIGSASRYYGLKLVRGKWRARRKVGGHETYLGRYEIEAEAALAYNFSGELVADKQFKPNDLPAADRPSPDRAEEIRAYVYSQVRRRLGDSKGG